MRSKTGSTRCCVTLSTALVIVTLLTSCKPVVRNTTGTYSSLENKSAKVDTPIAEGDVTPFAGVLVTSGRYIYLLKCESYCESRGVNIEN